MSFLFGPGVKDGRCGSCGARAPSERNVKCKACIEAFSPGDVVKASARYKSSLAHGREYVVLYVLGPPHVIKINGEERSRQEIGVFPLSGSPLQKMPGSVGVAGIFGWTQSYECDLVPGTSPRFSGPSALKLRERFRKSQQEAMEGQRADRDVYQGDPAIADEPAPPSKERPRATFAGVTFAGMDYGNGNVGVPRPVLAKILDAKVRAEVSYYYDGREVHQGGDASVAHVKQMASSNGKVDSDATLYPAKGEKPEHVHVRIHGNLSYDLFDATDADADIKAEIERLRKENEALRARRTA